MTNSQTREDLIKANTTHPVLDELLQFLQFTKAGRELKSRKAFREVKPSQLGVARTMGHYEKSFISGDDIRTIKETIVRDQFIGKHSVLREVFTMRELVQMNETDRNQTIRNRQTVIIASNEAKEYFRELIKIERTIRYINGLMELIHPWTIHTTWRLYDAVREARYSFYMKDHSFEAVFRACVVFLDTALSIDHLIADMTLFSSSKPRDNEISVCDSRRMLDKIETLLHGDSGVSAEQILTKFEHAQPRNINEILMTYLRSGVQKTFYFSLDEGCDYNTLLKEVNDSIGKGEALILPSSTSNEIQPSSRYCITLHYTNGEVTSAS